MIIRSRLSPNLLTSAGIVVNIYCIIFCLTAPGTKNGSIRRPGAGTADQVPFVIAPDTKNGSIRRPGAGTADQVPFVMAPDTKNGSIRSPGAGTAAQVPFIITLDTKSGSICNRRGINEMGPVSSWQ